MSLLVFLVKCGPLLSLAGLAAVFGFRWGPRFALLGDAGIIVVALGLWVAFQLYKQIHGWNLALLLVFSLAAGVLWGRLGAPVKVWLAWVLICVNLSLSLAWAYGLRMSLGWIASALTPCLGVYFGGWLALAFLPQPYVVTVIWAFIGVLLFLGMGIHLVSEARYLDAASTSVPLAGDLFIVYLNLYWLGAVL
jgi:hypothetical protein